ncbi:hypothetical protein Godav_021010, partial [Gossypium davidsonii]|nr:hypothetical protein [Gossypium davidsonii]
MMRTAMMIVTVNMKLMNILEVKTLKTKNKNSWWMICLITKDHAAGILGLCIWGTRQYVD